jgi:Leucine-rich repeat (LRR) protein
MSGRHADPFRGVSGAGANARARLLCLFVLAVLLPGAGSTLAQTAGEKHRQAAAALTKLGAAVKMSQEPDGTPFTYVSCYESSFGPKWKGTEADLNHLQGLTNLKILRIEWHGLTDVGLQHLKSLSTLKLLSLRGSARITDKGLGQLEGLTGLKELRLSGSLTTAAGLGRLSLKDLEMLEVSVTEFHLHKYPRLKTLYGSQVERIHATGAGSLQTLNLYHAPITDAGLADVRHLSKLKELDLVGCSKITHKGLAAIQGLGNLKTLDLREATAVTDAGLVHLKGLTRLEILRLGKTKITDAGLVHLKGLRSLLRLELDDTQVTDAGLEHLSGLSKLGYLGYFNTKLTPQGVQKLKKALPSLIHP